MADSMHKELVIKALMNAFRHQSPPPGIVIHSDRGSQYCSCEYQGALKHLGAICSMSRKGNCYDNAPMESFQSLLKNELNSRNPYRSRKEDVEKITEYSVLFYNRQRIQSGLSYKSPAVYAKDLRLQAIVRAA